MSALEIAQLGDRDERIATRRQRAEAKLAKLRAEKDGGSAAAGVGGAGGAASGGPGGKDKGPVGGSGAGGLGKQKVSEARATLEKLAHDSSINLTNIRVRFDNEENERRIIEENARYLRNRSTGRYRGFS